MSTVQRIVLAFLLFPIGIWCDDTCPPSGYTRLNATNFIKAVASRNSFVVHLQAVQDEATALGNYSLKGRLAILDNQTKYELAKGLMQANGFLEAWLGMKCLAVDGNCSDLSKWDWTEDGSSEYLSVEEGWLPENVTIEYDEQQCMRILLDYMGRSEWDNYYCDYPKGAIYELVVEEDPCETVACAVDEHCVPPACFLDEPKCQQNFRPCPDNPHGFEFGDHCYWIENIADTDVFENAAMSCGEGAILATPIHPVVRRLIFAKMQEATLTKLWIGLMQTGEKNGKVSDGWEIFDPYFGHNIPVEFTFIPWTIDKPNDADDIEDGKQENAIMTSQGYFSDKASSMTWSNAGAACQKKLYLTEQFTLVGFGQRIISPITGQINAHSVGKCARECYGSWACNAISYGNTNECYLHLLAKEDHENVTTLDAAGFRILKRAPQTD